MSAAKVEENNGCEVTGDFSGCFCPASLADLVASAGCENRGAGALVIAGVSVGVNVIGDFCEGGIFEKIESDVVLDMFDVVEKVGGWKVKGDVGLVESGSATFVTEVSVALGSVPRG